MSKILFITGAEKEIGKAIAIHAAEEGHKLILHSHSEEKLNDLTRALDKLDSTYLSFTFELDDFSAYSRVVEIAKSKFEKIDALINTENVARSASMQEMTLEDFDNMWKINVKGVVNGISLITPVMKNQENGGDIINVISSAGKEGVENWSGYSATMFAVRGFTQAVAKEVMPFGIRLMNIFPGMNGMENNDAAMALEQDKLLRSDDVAQAVLNAITFHRRAVITEMDIYPSNSK